MLSFSEDETAKRIKAAKSDMDRLITYDPVKRPEVANLLLLASLCTKRAPAEIAAEIGDGGASRLKAFLTEALNEYLRPLRQRRRELEKDPQYVRRALRAGIARAREVAQETLAEVRQAMGMEYEIEFCGLIAKPPPGGTMERYSVLGMIPAFPKIRRVGMVVIDIGSMN